MVGIVNSIAREPSEWIDEMMGKAVDIIFLLVDRVNWTGNLSGRQ
jgi:hypothetical protein